jgi:predicted Zn-dependent protease
MKKTLQLYLLLVVIFPFQYGFAENGSIPEEAKPYHVQTPEELLQTATRLRDDGNFTEAMRVAYVAMQFSEEPAPAQLEYARACYAYLMASLDPEELEKYISTFEEYGGQTADHNLEAEYKAMTGMLNLCMALLDGKNGNYWHDASRNLERVCDLMPDNSKWKRKWIWARIKSGELPWAEDGINDLLKDTPDDPLLYEALSMIHAMKAQQQPEPEIAGKGFEHALMSIELSLKQKETKIDDDPFDMLLGNLVTPVSKIRELVAPCDLEMYVKKARELKTRHPDLWELIARSRMVKTYSDSDFGLREVLAQKQIPYKDNPIYCLEYGFACDFRGPNEYPQALACFEQMIREGTLRTTGYFYRGDTKCWQGLANRNNSLIEESIPDFEKTRESAPEWQYAYLKLGWAHLHLQQFDEAEKTFEKGLTFGTRHIPLNKGMVNLNFRRLNQSPREAGYAKAIFEHLKKFVDDNLHNIGNQIINSNRFDFDQVPEALDENQVFSITSDLIEQGKTAEAVKRYEWLAKQHPDLAREGVNYEQRLGLIHYNEKNWPKAVEHLFFCLNSNDRLDSYHQDNYADIFAESLFRQEKYDELADCYLNLFSRNMERRMNYDGASRYYFAAGMYESKKGTLEQIVNLCTNFPQYLRQTNPEAVMFAGDRFLEAKDYDGAYNLYFFELFQNQSISETYYPHALRIARDFVKNDSLHHAIELYKVFLEHEPKHVEALKELAEVFTKLGFVDAATETTKGIVIAEPTNIGNWRQLVEALVKQSAFGHRDVRELLDLELTPEMTPDYDDILEQRIDAAYIVNDWKSAVRDLNVLIRRKTDQGRTFPSRGYFPHELNAQTLLAFCFLRDEKFGEVIKYSENWTTEEKDQTQSDLLNAIRGDALIRLKMWQSAIDHYMRIVDKELGVSHEKHHLWTLIGHCHLELNDPLNAGRAFGSAIKAAPEYGNAYYGRFLSCREMLKKTEIQKDEKKKAAFEKMMINDLNTAKEYRNGIIWKFPPWEGGRVDLEAETKSVMEYLTK